MSNSLEESPISDTKMDISETTSQESPCFSPDTDRITSNLNINTIIITNSKNQLNNDCNNDDDCHSVDNGDETTTTIKLLDNHENNINGAVTTIIDQEETCGDDEDDDDDDDKVNDSSALIITANNKNTTIIQSTSSLRSSSALTLVNKHPLMSPPPNIKNMEQHQVDHYLVAEKTVDTFNYPDIVPQMEKHTTSGDRLDIVTNLKPSGGTLRKITLLHEGFLSDSESEPDLSQYQATVEPTLQSVSLITLHSTANSCNFNPSSNKLSYHNNTNANKLRRKVPISSSLLGAANDDHSSIDSISNHSLDGDADLDDDDDDNDDDNNDDDDSEPNLASVSPTSSIMDDITFNDDIIATPTNNENNINACLKNAGGTVDPLPQYTADEERRDSRNWQKITLPDGKTREIDMKVIDPYKRVLSHGGYLKAGGHNAIVVFSACHLPDRSRTDYHYVMDNLFLYVVKTLEHLVTEDYVLVYLHGGSNRSTVPPFPWLKKCYQLIDRRLRKSLKNLFLVHPTFWLKSIVWMSRPFVSAKFWRKMIYVRTLEDLYKLVPVEKAAVPDKVKNYNSKFT